MHLDLLNARALASLAPPAGHVERKVGRRQPLRLCVPRSGHNLPYLVVCLYVRDGVRPRAPSYRGLVEHDDARDIFHACYLPELADPFDAPVEPAGKCGVKHVAHERALSRARHARHAYEHTERDRDGDVLEIVLADARKRKALSAPLPPFLRHLYSRLARHVFPRQRLRLLPEEIFHAPLVDDLPSPLPGERAELYDIVRLPYHLEVVLDYDDSIIPVAELLYELDEAVDVPRMKTYRRLVHYVQRFCERRSELARQVHPLRLTAGKSTRKPGKSQVFEADLVQEIQPRPYLLQYLRRDGDLVFREREVFEEFTELPYRELRQLRDVSVRDTHP